MGGVHLHLADDEIGHRLDAPSDDDHELLGEVLGLAEHPLNRIRRADLRSVLPQRVAVVVDSLVDLAIRHGLGGWGHDLDHGVILSLVWLALLPRTMRVLACLWLQLSTHFQLKIS